MQAVLVKTFGGADQLFIGHADTPALAEHEVLVKVHAAGVNRADILQREGKYPPPVGASEIIGLEIAGEVVSLGANSTKWNVGDQVFGLLPGGGYAQYAGVHEDMLMALPEHMSYTECAAIPEAFLTAYQSLVTLAKLQSSEQVLIHAGGSGVGTAAIQIAKLIGANPIITASKAKHDICRSLGASNCIDYQSENFQKVIMEVTDGKGVDVILDFVAAKYFQQNLNSLALDGRMVMLAFLGGVKVPEVNLVPILSKRLQIMGSTLRSRTLDYQIALTKDFHQFGYAALTKGLMKPVIDKIYPWDQVQQAHERMEANLNIGKIVLEIGH